ncbi:MAG TPA: cytochrome c [Thermoleophilaceae bacterium]|jgi:ubiquinol-cytochrome c reductase cytochrome c subunit
MTGPRLLAALCLAALVVAAPAVAQPSSGVSKPKGGEGLSLRELGEQLYAGNCSSCHGIDGRGVRSPRPGAGDVPSLGPSLRGVGELAPDFYLRTGYMPLGNPYDQPTRRDPLQFSDREIRALVDYVGSLRGGPAIPAPHPEQGNVAEGQQLFTEHCGGCHQVAARGGFVTGARVPPLGDASTTQIAEAVRIGPYVMPRFSKKQISDPELDSIIAYVQRTKHPVDRGGWGIGNVGPIPEGMVTWFIAAIVLVMACVVIGERIRA